MPPGSVTGRHRRAIEERGMTPDALLRELPDADTEQQRLDEDCEAMRSVIGGTARAAAGLRKTTTRNSPWPSGRVPDGALPAFVDASALVAMPRCG